MDYSAYWKPFLKKELSFYDVEEHKYLKKGYLHFDDRIWFPDFQDSFQKFISKEDSVATHPFYPFLRVTIETKRIRFNKEKGRRVKEIKPRNISFAAHLDSLIYSFYSSVLDNLYEKHAANSPISDCSLAYRPLEKSNVEFAHSIFESLKEFHAAHGDTVAIALDVKGFFDTLDHDHLKNAWLKLLQLQDAELTQLPRDQFQLFRSLTGFSFVEKEKLLPALGITQKELVKTKPPRFCSPERFRNKVRAAKIIEKNTSGKGIPQGSPISAVLSNIYMMEYDETVSKLQDQYQFIYKRYCDDILLVCKKSDYIQLRKELYILIEHYKLAIQPEKEDIVFFTDKGKGLTATSISGTTKKLQYLGFEFDGKRTFIRPSSLSRYHRKVKTGVRTTVKKAYGSRSQGNRIFRKELYDKYSHLGARNFITYALRSAKIMDSESIRKQVSRHMEQLKVTVEAKRNKQEAKLKRKGRKFTRMQ